jgi:hypothetical protein
MQATVSSTFRPSAFPFTANNRRSPSVNLGRRRLSWRFRISFSDRKYSMIACWCRFSQPAKIPRRRQVGIREVILANFSPAPLPRKILYSVQVFGHHGFGVCRLSKRRHVFGFGWRRLHRQHLGFAVSETRDASDELNHRAVPNPPQPP